MTHAITSFLHTSLHYAHESLALVAGLIFLAACLGLVCLTLTVLKQSTLDTWRSPPRLQALQDESPAENLTRSRLEAFSSIRVTLPGDPEEAYASSRFVILRSRVLVAIFLLICLIAIVGPKLQQATPDEPAPASQPLDISRVSEARVPRQMLTPTASRGIATA